MNKHAEVTHRCWSSLLMTCCHLTRSKSCDNEWKRDHRLIQTLWIALRMWLRRVEDTRSLGEPPLRPGLRGSRSSWSVCVWGRDGGGCIHTSCPRAAWLDSGPVNRINVCIIQELLTCSRHTRRHTEGSQGPQEQHMIWQCVKISAPAVRT